MVRLTARQRDALGETVRDLANYGAAALVFGQFVREGTVSWPMAVAGIVIWLGLVTFALKLEGE